jgi:hypothetical protein
MRKYNFRGFGDFNNRAIEEDWYKGAVLLHEESPDSILFSVPFDAGKCAHLQLISSRSLPPVHKFREQDRALSELSKA